MSIENYTSGSNKVYVDQPAARPQTPVESELSRVRAALGESEKMLADLHERLRPAILAVPKGETNKPDAPAPACSDLEADLRSLGDRIRSMATRLEVIHSGLRL